MNRKEKIIIDLWNKGMKKVVIAKTLGFTWGTVDYYINKKDRISRRTEWFRKKPLEERRNYYKKRKKYIREYFRKRYNEDEEFRKKELLRHKKK